MTTATDLRLIGCNDEQTTCDKCGKIELRGTVIIADGDGNEIGRYGTTCATRVLNNGTKITRDYARAAEFDRRQNVMDELRQARKHFEAGELFEARWYIKEARRWYGLHRPDELAIAERIESA